MFFVIYPFALIKDVEEIYSKIETERVCLVSNIQENYFEHDSPSLTICELFNDNNVQKPRIRIYGKIAVLN